MSAEFEPVGTEAAIVAARIRLQEHARRIDSAERLAAAMDKEISEVKKGQIAMTKTLEQVVEFQRTLKKLGFVVAVGVGGILGTQVMQLIMRAKP